MRHQWGRFAVLLLRDTGFMALTMAAWAQVQDLQGGGIGWIAASIGTALMTVLSAFLVHEWGHLIGAWLARSTFFLPARPFESPFLFKFDNRRNTRAQFVWMAGGGFVSSFAMVLLLVAVLPKHLLAGQVALAIVALGVIATFVIEVPEVWRVHRGGPLPDGAAFMSPAEVRR